MSALYYGYDIEYMKSNSRKDIRMWLQVFCIVTIILTLIGALRSTLNHIRTAFLP